MELKWITILFAIGSRYINVIADNKNRVNEEVKKTSSEDRLKYEFGCIPIEKWKLIQHHSNNEFVRNACTSNSYEVYISPSEPNLTQVGVLFRDRQILEIDERKNSITLLIELWSFWEDPRIKRNLFLEKYIPLPSITDAWRPIWTPFIFPGIRSLKKLGAVHEPILSYISLVSGESMNYLLSKIRNTTISLYPPNATIVHASAKRKVKIFCKFDFSKYPFDSQDCPLTMNAYDINVTVYNGKKLASDQDTFSGHNLIQDVFIKTGFSTFRKCHRNYFGVYNKITRQIETFIYQCYAPCIFIVTMSFSSFIIPLTAIPGRVAIIVTQFLTLTNIFVHQMVCIVMSSKLFLA